MNINIRGELYDLSSSKVMGILNLTPDSFSDGGKFNNDSKSFRHISNMIYYGANIIDVGGESTRPGSKSIKPKFEWKRVKSVIKNFKRKYKNVCLSFDTRKSDLMVQGIENGVDLINDVSGFSYDKKSLSNIKNYNVIKKIKPSKNIVIGFGITEKTISNLRSADGLVVGSAICREITRSLKHRQNPVTNVSKLVSKLKNKTL